MQCDTQLIKICFFLILRYVFVLKKSCKTIESDPPISKLIITITKIILLTFGKYAQLLFCLYIAHMKVIDYLIVAIA